MSRLLQRAHAPVPTRRADLMIKNGLKEAPFDSGGNLGQNYGLCYVGPVPTDGEATA